MAADSNTEIYNKEELRGMIKALNSAASGRYPKSKTPFLSLLMIPHVVL